MKTIIGIDNGCTGTIGIIHEEGSLFEVMPTKQSLMGRAGKKVTRVDLSALTELLKPYTYTNNAYAYVERPFTGKFLNAVLPAQRTLEATLIGLELLGIGYTIVDSKEWQLEMLGKIKGSANLKEASMLRGMQMYPQFAAQIKKHGDADGLLMARYFCDKQG